ncbi:MAG: OmpA family protein, partial [Pseudomonadota bacterium]
RSTNLGVVDSIAEIAAWCPAADIIVEGHTDDRGDAALNAALSLARARAVADALAARGIRHERLISRGLGSSKPIADNATRDGRAKNRRIEIRFAVGDA